VAEQVRWLRPYDDAVIAHGHGDCLDRVVAHRPDCMLATSEAGDHLSAPVIVRVFAAA